MVLQKVVEEGHLEVSDTLTDDNNTAIRVRREDRRQCVHVYVLVWQIRNALFFPYNTPTHKNIHSHISPQGSGFAKLAQKIVVMVTCLLGGYKGLFSFISLSLSLWYPPSWAGCFPYGSCSSPCVRTINSSPMKKCIGLGGGVILNVFSTLILLCWSAALLW